jgi:hypothetical protein
MDDTDRSVERGKLYGARGRCLGWRRIDDDMGSRRVLSARGHAKIVRERVDAGLCQAALIATT